MKNISFQGLHGAYSEVVCKKLYKDYQTLPCNSFEDAFEAVENSLSSLAMIPVENSLAGRVSDMHFILQNTDLKIVAEYYQKIEHNLLVNNNVTLKDLKKTLSHSHALSQCKNEIRKLKLEPVNFIDTAGAAKFISESKDKTLSAIASSLSAKIYNLKILKKNIEDQKKNITRFLVFSKKQKEISIKQKVKTTLVFNLNNHPASLYKVLGAFAENKINLTRLESFFVNENFKQYSFLIDVECHVKFDSFVRAHKRLQEFSTYNKILGCYPSLNSRS